MKKKYADRIMELRAEDNTLREIAKIMSKETDKNWSKNSVNKVLKDAEHSAKNYYAKKGKLEKHQAEKYFDTVDKINKIAGEVWGIYKPLLDTIKELEKKIEDSELSKKNVDMLTKLLNSLSRQTSSLLKLIEHVDKVMGKIKDQNFKVTYNINDLSRKIVQMRKKFEKRFNVKFPKSRKMKEKMKNYVG